MQDTAFQPLGPTVLVTGGPVQVLATANLGATSYRIRNVTVTNAYIAWAPALASGATPSITAIAPTPGFPVQNTLGMLATSVEAFRLPANAWFRTSAAGTFEVTPGEGL